MVARPPIPEEYSLQSYFFALPEERIAQYPTPHREQSRLLLVSKGETAFSEYRFADLPDLLPPGALLVRNDTKVLPARLLATKPTGGRCEFLLLTPLPCLVSHADGPNRWWAEAEGLVRGLKPGQRLNFSGLEVQVMERLEFGRCRVELRWQGDLAQIFLRHGHMPLPPYINRPNIPADLERYQTVYAHPAKVGSAAAPTAGLHFTSDLLDTILARGITMASISLYVGYGTFSPVRCEDIREHQMHAEYVEVPPETAQGVAAAKASGRPVVAVGTTSARALESLPRFAGGIRPWQGWTDLYILPGHRFHVVDSLITNFHLPGSSLLIMVAALAGLTTIRAAYSHALEAGFRFFSYGDAMFIR